MTEWKPIEEAPLDMVVLVWWQNPLGHGMAWPAIISEHEGSRYVRHADFVAECELPDLNDAALWASLCAPDGQRFSTLDESK